MSTTMYLREDAAAERVANSKPLVSIPQVWEWEAEILTEPSSDGSVKKAKVPLVFPLVRKVPKGTKIGRDPQDPKRVIVPQSFVRKLQDILLEVEQKSGTKQDDGSCLEVFFPNGKKPEMWWVKYTSKNSFFRVPKPEKINLIRRYEVPDYLCDLLYDTSSFRRTP